MYFRRHVLRSTQLSFLEPTSVISYKRGRKAKVSNLEGEVLVVKNIVRLQVSVGNSFFVAMMHRLSHLVEVEPRNVLLESSCFYQEVNLGSFAAVVDGCVDHFFFCSVTLLYYSSLWN